MHFNINLNFAVDMKYINGFGLNNQWLMADVNVEAVDKYTRAYAIKWSDTKKVNLTYIYK